MKAIFFKAKYNKGKALHYDQTWFFGAIDDATNRIAIENRILFSIKKIQCIQFL